jgi:integrase
VHLRAFGTGPTGRVFSGVQGGELASITYRRAWDKARNAALAPDEYKCPLAKRVYGLRHACVSTWLNGGVPPAQVAEWAEHSVAVLLKVYAKCIDGQDQIAKRRIEDATQATSRRGGHWRRSLNRTAESWARIEGGPAQPPAGPVRHRMPTTSDQRPNLGLSPVIGQP